MVFTLEKLTQTTADPDLWGYLSFGRLFWETGRFPYRDVFSYVPTLDLWVYHEWLTGVIFYPLFQALGAPGLQLLKFGGALATLGLLYLTARRRGADFWGAIIILTVAQGFLTSGYSPVRAQIFTYAFFALTLYVLETARLRGRWRRLWFLVPLQVVWCNLHGGFLSGLGLIGLYGLGEALSRRPFRPYLAVFLAAGLATLINPYGVAYWQYLYRAISMPRPDITEWVSVWRAWQTGQARVAVFYFLVVILLALFLAWRTRWRELTPILVLGVTLALGFAQQRHQVFFLMLVGAYVPLLLTPYLKVLTSDPTILTVRERLGWRVPGLVGAFLVLALSYNLVSGSPLSLQVPSQAAATSHSQIYYPVGGAEYIQQRQISGNLLTEFQWGEYLIWILYPHCRVALDGRFETVYPDGVFREYRNFYYGQAGWREFLEHYPPDLILVGSRSRIASLLQDTPQWRRVYLDFGCALFVRRD